MENLILRRMTTGIPKSIGVFQAEEPLYFVLEKKGHRDVRDYKSYLSVYTDVSGVSYEEAITLGYWKLYDYFLFNNLGERDLSGAAAGADRAIKMDLTYPVFEANMGLAWRISMMIPSKYSMKTVPLPTDSSVHLVNVPEHTVAVIRSSGAMSAEKNEKNTHQLAGWLKKMGRFIISGQPYVAHQNLFPVFEFLRRTEIHIPLEIEK